MPLTSFHGFGSKHCSTLGKTQSANHLFGRRNIVSLATKWYGVKVGRKPGVYRTWEECEQQVKGVSKAKHKSFSSFEEAKQFAQVDHAGSKRSFEEVEEPAELLEVAPGRVTSHSKHTEAQENGSKLQGTFKLMFDGGSRGNPGPAGAGAILYQPSGDEVGRVSFACGRTTNNVAEYTGLLKGMQAAHEHGVTDLHVQGDSLLVINQMDGSWKVRNEGLKRLHEQAKEVSRHFETLKFEHIYRDQNSVADLLANTAMDGGGWEGLLCLEAEPASKKVRT